MLHRVLNPDYNIKLIIPLYPAWADRMPGNTPCHLLRYGPCATPKGPTGELLSGFPLLHDRNGAEHLGMVELRRLGAVAAGRISPGLAALGVGTLDGAASQHRRADDE
jgi:hypothetical protein